MNYVYKVRKFFGKYISLVFGFQNFVIDLIWYCIRFFFGYAAKKNFNMFRLTLSLVGTWPAKILKFRLGS